MQTETEQLITEIEAVAVSLGISPSTVGERAGQGGRFYARLKSGARAWPETIRSVRNKIAEMQEAVLSSGCDISHGCNATTVQEVPADIPPATVQDRGRA